MSVNRLTTVTDALRDSCLFLSPVETGVLAPGAHMCMQPTLVGRPSKLNLSYIGGAQAERHLTKVNSYLHLRKHGSFNVVQYPTRQTL